MANTGDGSAWDEADPADSGLVSGGPTQFRDLRIGTRRRIEKEHVAYAAAVAGGEHKNGSAKAYFNGVAPTQRPDAATALDANDNGRLWMDAGVMKFYSHPTWSPISTLNAGVPIAVLLHQVAVTTGGGSFTTGSWVTRVLNTEFDPSAIVTLAANQFALAAGTYYIRAWANAYRVNANLTRLQNITDGSTTLFGSGEMAANNSAGSTSKSFVEGTFVIAGAKTYELQHRCESTNSGINGRGYPQFAWGGSEVHAGVQIAKLA